MAGSIPAGSTRGEYNLKQPQMENHLILSRNKDVRPPVKIAKVDTRKGSTSRVGQEVKTPPFHGEDYGFEPHTWYKITFLFLILFILDEKVYII